jgi:hypothetical protein
MQAAQPRAGTRRLGLERTCEEASPVNISLWGVVITGALLLIAVGTYLLERHNSPSTPPGQHQRSSKRLPQQPIRQDDEPASSQENHELDNGEDAP